MATIWPADAEILTPTIICRDVRRPISGSNKPKCKWRIELPQTEMTKVNRILRPLGGHSNRFGFILARFDSLNHATLDLFSSRY